MAKTKRNKPMKQAKRPTAKNRRRGRQGGNITRLRFRAPDGTSITLPFWRTDSVHSVKKQLHAKTGNWYNVCSGARCVGDSKDEHLYSTLLSAGLIPREPHRKTTLNLYLVAARGLGGSSPFRAGHNAPRSLAYVPVQRTGRKRQSSVGNLTHKGPEFAIARQIFAYLEDRARALEDLHIDVPMEEYRLRKLRADEEPDPREEDAIYTAGTERVDQGIGRSINGLLFPRNPHREFTLPGLHETFRWPGGRLTPRTGASWRSILDDYFRRGEEDAINSPDPNWRWSSYLGAVKRSL